MWKLVKEELKYNNIVLLGISITAIQLLLYLIFGNYDKINVLLLLLVLIFHLSILINRSKEKTERQNCTLPLSIYSLGLSRTIFLLVPWMIVIIGFYILNYILLPSTFSHVAILLGQFSFAFILFFMAVFIQDIYLFNLGSKKIIRYISSFLASLLIFCLTLVVIFSIDLIDPKFQIGTGILLIYAWGILLSLLVVISFAKRKFYS
jgi:hypothetical protein